VNLLRAEARRFRSRRFIRALMALAVLGFVAGIVIASTQYAKATPEALAKAQQQVQDVVADAERFRQQCLADPPSGAPPAIPVEELCGPVPTPEGYGGAEGFLEDEPFLLARDGLDGAAGVAFAGAALAFLLGATSIGAEWSTKSLVALLFWEPRRLRVMGAKLLVLTTAAALLAAVGQLLWLGGARFLASTRGDPTVPDGFYGDLLGTAGRGVLVTVVTALLGFGFANAIRNTGAALGVGFVYFAIVENTVRALKPTWAQWLISDNTAALLQRDRYEIVVSDRSADGVRTLVVTHAEAGLYLVAVSAAVVGIGVVLFARRDLS
jgi:ABC-2 type transport system permease protein